MTDRQREVATSDDLLAAADDPDVRRIVVAADLTDVPGFRLSPGQALVGSGQVVRFAMDQDGLRLTADNEVSNLHLAAAPDRRALFNDTAVERLGRMLLTDLRVSGVVRLLARDRVRSGHVEAHGIDIIAADARGFEERPTGFGVEVVAGVFTLWNQQADAGVTITADLTGLRAGRAGAPVRGSGIFVSGAGGAGGRLIAGRLETGPVFSDGG
ncbi:MAG: hypothetical protein JO046_07430, partial [Solirubrobacterales bacterium]|nr:hypothetical protein [Solirubrobacterales bacterium]